MHQLETFIQNFQKQNHMTGISNVYVIETYNKQNERTNCCYGMNLMTDLGFIKRYSEGVDFPTNLYVGNGTNETFQKSSNVMMSVLFNGLAATVADKNKNHAIPLFYAKGVSTGDGIITTMCRFLKASYDYTISGVSADTLITEYGIGTSYDQLWTHSFVYDIKGQKTTITKKKEEKLVIHVYLSCSYYENLITDNWTNGRYPMITTNQYMFRRFVPSNVYTYKRYNIKQARKIQQTVFSKVENSTITNTTTVANFTVVAGSGNDAGYFDGWALYDDGFIMIEPQSLDTAETFVLENLMSIDPTQVYGYSRKFGLNTGVPITQLTISKVQAFNAKTKAWNAQLTYYNDSTRVYDETSMQATFAVPIYYSNTINYNGDPDKWFDNVLKLYVYQNMYTDNPIIAIETSASTVYAAEKYWDKSTWIEISDFKNIPTDARNYRYWMTNVNNSSMNITREREPFYLKTLNANGSYGSGYETFTTFKQYSGSYYYQNYNQCDNYDYGWYLKADRVFVPKNELSFKTTTSSKWCANFTYGKWLVVIPTSATALSVFDMSQVQTSTTPPTATTVTLPFTNEIVLYNTSVYRTESCTGILCIHNGNECCIVDLRGDTITTSKLNARKACAIYGTTYVAYIPIDSVELRIYDVETASDIKSVVLPNTTSIPKILCGHTDYVWFTDGSTYEYVANIKESAITFDSVEVSGKYMMTSGKIQFTCVDRVLMMYDMLTKDVTTAVYFTLDDVKTQKRIPTSFVNDDTGIYANYATCFYLRYVEDNVLMLMITATNGSTGCRCSTVDFGQYLANGTVMTTQKNESSLCSYTLFGKYVIQDHYIKTPGINYMPIRIEGTTTTVGSNTTSKQIENKSFMLSYTNEPVFMGMPPGVQS